MIANVISGALMIAGSFWTMAAGVGMARFPDALSRLHAVAKPQVLGLILVLGGLAVYLRSFAVAAELLLVVAFQFVTAPLAAHMVGRAATLTGAVRPDLLMVNDLVVNDRMVNDPVGNELIIDTAVGHTAVGGTLAIDTPIIDPLAGHTPRVGETPAAAGT